MKRDWDAKAVAHTSIWLGKRESGFYEKCMMPKKPKTCSSNWNIENFRHRSHNEMFWFKNIKWYDVHGAKWKFSKLCNQVYVGGHVCIFL